MFKKAIFLFVALAGNAYGVCGNAGFSRNESAVSNSHRAEIYIIEKSEDKYAFMVGFDSEFEEILTLVKKDECDRTDLRPFRMANFQPVSEVNNIYEFSWYYEPGGSAYAGKYLCFMYVRFSKEFEKIYNSCEELVNNPGLPPGYGGTIGQIVGEKLIIEDHTGRVVHESKL